MPQPVTRSKVNAVLEAGDALCAGRFGLALAGQRIRAAGWLLTAALAAASTFAQVEAGLAAPAAADGKVKIVLGPADAITLEARAARVGLALDTLSQALRIPIRYANAPEPPVSVTCRAAGLVRVLHCLLGADADLVVTQAETGKRGSSPQVTSVTVLGSTFRTPPPSSAAPDSAARPPLRDKTPDTPDAVLAMTRSADPEQRAVGLERLRRVNGIDDATLKNAYQFALHDADGDVRAAAISGLALLDEAGSSGLLSAAMADEHPSVRLAALDSLALNRDTRPLYEQALTDADETVRELAALRLGLE